MAYKNKEMKSEGYGPKVKDFSKPSSCYAESFDQEPTKYIERQNKQQERAAKQIKKQSYQGRYS
jgi:hypothetical protein